MERANRQVERANRQEGSDDTGTTDATTSSTSAPRVVGEPLPTWIVVGAGLAVLVAILVAGTIVRARLARSEDRRPT